jgi:hypothetical protein
VRHFGIRQLGFSRVGRLILPLYHDSTESCFYSYFTIGPFLCTMPDHSRPCGPVKMLPRPIDLPDLALSEFFLFEHTKDRFADQLYNP